MRLGKVIWVLSPQHEEVITGGFLIARCTRWSGFSIQQRKLEGDTLVMSQSRQMGCLTGV